MSPYLVDSMPNVVLDSRKGLMYIIGMEEYMDYTLGDDPNEAAHDIDCDCAACMYYEDVHIPDVDDSVKCCPDCERPNQFGELCPDCRRCEQERISAEA